MTIDWSTVPPRANDLTLLPARMRRLPLDQAGRPIPKFVEWIEGKPDFRIMSADHLVNALRFRQCWVCGEPLGRHATFVAGPMCGVNRTSAEPPSHRDCASWSAQHCPFLANPQKQRRDTDLPEHGGMAGIGIMRNPGVTMLWTSTGWRTRRVPNGILWQLGEPEAVEWLAYGRPATRAEVEHSIDTGLPALAELAAAEGPAAVAELDRLVARLERWLPAGGV